MLVMRKIVSYKKRLISQFIYQGKSKYQTKTCSNQTARPYGNLYDGKTALNPAGIYLSFIAPSVLII